MTYSYAGNTHVDGLIRLRIYDHDGFLDITEYEIHVSVVRLDHDVGEHGELAVCLMHTYLHEGCHSALDLPLT